MKRLYCLLDNDDLWQLIAFCHSQGLSVFGSNGQSVTKQSDLLNQPDIISFYVCTEGTFPPLKQVKSRTWIPDGTEGVFIDRTLVNERGLYTPGVISLDGEDPAAQNIYKTLAQFAKRQYHRCWDGRTYIAPNLYRRWLAGELSFHFFVDAAYFDVPQSALNFSEFVPELQKHGMKIVENGRDIREPETCISPGAEEYFIHVPNAKQHTWLAARRSYHFTDSEGVFLYLVKKRGVPYERFIVDERFLNGVFSESTVQNVFAQLKMMLSEHIEA